MRSGTVRFRGPSTREEKAAFDAAIEAKQRLAEGLALSRAALERERDPDERADLLHQIDWAEELTAKYQEFLPNDLFPVDPQKIADAIASAFPKRTRRKG